MAENCVVPLSMAKCPELSVGSPTPGLARELGALFVTFFGTHHRGKCVSLNREKKRWMSCSGELVKASMFRPGLKSTGVSRKRLKTK